MLFQEMIGNIVAFFWYLKSNFELKNNHDYVYKQVSRAFFYLVAIKLRLPF